MRTEEVAATWDVGEVRAVRPLDGGSINGAFRVEGGAGEFHLRVYRNPDRARVEREHAAVAVAVRVGVPTPAPLPTRAGGTIAAGAGLAALFPVAPGAPVPRGDLTPGHAAALGTFLAELHERLPAEVPCEVPEVRPASVERTLERLAHLRASPLCGHLPAFPARFLHGDYHDGNVFFQGPQPSALIDWEQTRLAPRAWEVVRCLHLSLKLDPVLSAAFLAGYRRRRPLPAEELAGGAAFYALGQERNVWTYESVYLGGNSGPRRFIGPPPYLPFGTAWTASDLR